LISKWSSLTGAIHAPYDNLCPSCSMMICICSWLLIMIIFCECVFLSCKCLIICVFTRMLTMFTVMFTSRHNHSRIVVEDNIKADTILEVSSENALLTPRSGELTRVNSPSHLSSEEHGSGVSHLNLLVQVIFEQFLWTLLTLIHFY
jgi:hypothetical protein